LVERNLAKVEVESSSLFSRSKFVDKKKKKKKKKKGSFGFPFLSAFMMLTFGLMVGMFTAR
jgi:hypothetical protein